MSVRKPLTLFFLTVVLAACGPSEESGSPETTQDSGKSAAGASEYDRDSESELPEPEAVMESADEQSGEIWAMIQEKHGKLTSQQQRSLQACAELAVMDEGADVEQAIEQCREEMEELAKEQQQSGDGNGERQESEGTGDSNG